MWGILTFSILILALYLGFGWLADHPGSATFIWFGQSLEIPMVLFLAGAAALIVVSILLVWIVVKLFQAPSSVSSWNSGRRRSKGHSYLSRGVLAAGAGNATLARQMIKKSRGRVGEEDRAILGFLDAQTALIEGDHERAVSIFRDMENDPDTKVLALRGLYLEAKRVDDETGQEYYAERALRIAPNLPWAAEAVLERKSASGQWDDAMRVLEAQRSIDLVDDAGAKRLRAIILTGKSRDWLESDPKGARGLARKAQKIDPGFVPAALAAAAAAGKLNDPRRVTRYIETTWVNAPHPDLADAYIHADPGDTAGDRLKRAKKLKALNGESVEADMAIARVALETGDYPLARTSALSAASKRPSESVYLLLADIEEEETGDVGLVREWLAQAIAAPRDPVWMAEGVILDEWQAVSPVNHKLGAVEWKAPVEHREQSAHRILEDRGRRYGNDARVIGSHSSSAGEAGSRSVNGTKAPVAESDPHRARSVASAPGAEPSSDGTYPSALLAIKAHSDEGDVRQHR
ncbi:heme biosynthesis protein HemY [Fulvimarina endophytica]|uniref:Heme biosynthesis protein HemY n=1 Tax=Fulvimarina endophytica TaxID=2293836 RepID=A0A371X1M3_9HYPH|nr:heme biosynthesis HemY N-terminal domain-containing protein [Fulvimarina endophytica]RFC63121.1 heme biosynthesis protein HemY [Fulvimarina endophytica]